MFYVSLGKRFPSESHTAERARMPAVKGDGMRGLAVFISDIRNCKSKEAELKRINRELANIRSKFKGFILFILFIFFFCFWRFFDDWRNTLVKSFLALIHFTNIIDEKHFIEVVNFSKVLFHVCVDNQEQFYLLLNFVCYTYTSR